MMIVKVNTLLLLLMISSCILMAQEDSDTLTGIKLGKRIVHTANDTIPLVINADPESPDNLPLWYLNGEMVDGQIFKTLDPNKIAEINVEKTTGEKGGVTYNGIIYVKTKDSYCPKLISLNALKEKYLDIPPNSSTLFLLDGAVIHGDHDRFKVDENYILKIESEVVDHLDQNLELIVVKLSTRTKDNLEKVNTIRLKGGLHEKSNVSY